MKASSKIIQKMKTENPLHLDQGCFADAFIQIPPIRGLVKAAAAIGPGGHVVKKQSMSKIREVQKSVGSGAGTKSRFSIFFFMEIISKIYFL